MCWVGLELSRPGTDLRRLVACRVLDGRRAASELPIGLLQNRDVQRGEHDERRTGGT